MPETPHVSVIVVSFNTRDHLRACLERIEPEHEVVVVDNASHDGSAEMVHTEFPHVRLIANAENRGFGAANNQGISGAVGELVLLLNSDAYPAPEAVSALAGVFADSGVVAAGGLLRNSDGSVQESVTRHLSLWHVFAEQTYLEPLLRRLGLGYWCTHAALANGATVVPVGQVTGACLMMRPIERFDERFFLYCEDTELCRRLETHGVIVFVPGAEFTHALGASSEATRWVSVARYNRGKELYFAIHHGRAASGMCWVLNRLGALLRLLVWGLLAVLTVGAWGPARRRVGLFARVLSAPVAGPPNG